jgi:hypothetical protein
MISNQLENLLLNISETAAAHQRSKHRGIAIKIKNMFGPLSRKSNYLKGLPVSLVYFISPIPYF